MSDSSVSFFLLPVVSFFHICSDTLASKHIVEKIGNCNFWGVYLTQYSTHVQWKRGREWERVYIIGKIKRKRKGEGKREGEGGRERWR